MIYALRAEENCADPERSPSITYERVNVPFGRRVFAIKGSTPVVMLSPYLLICRGHLDVIDNEDVHGSRLGFQFQPELLLHRCEDGRRGKVRHARGSIGAAANRSCAVFRGPIELKIVATSEFGFINDFAVQSLS